MRTSIGPAVLRSQQGPATIDVDIQRPSLNTRILSSSIIVDRPVADVWGILTDYDNSLSARERPFASSLAGPRVKPGPVLHLQ